MTTGPRDVTVGDEAGRLDEAASIFSSLIPAVQEWCASLPEGDELGFVGCGSSLDIPEALVDAAGRGTAVSASEPLPPAGVTWVALTRSGGTREVMQAMDSGAINHVITCSPDSPAARRARHVLDLSAAADSGFVAALSALVTAGAVAVALGEDPREVTRVLAETPQVLNQEHQGLRGASAVAWLGPWRAYPIARELARKTIETGRRASYAHQFEFLHGDDQMYPGNAAWVALGDVEANDAFAELVDVARLERVVRLDVDWEGLRPLDVVSLLSHTYQLIFSRQRK